MNRQKENQFKRKRRARRTRSHVRGTPERPRLTVHRSLRHVRAQLVDDTAGRTLCAVSSLSPGLREQLPYWGNAKAAALVGKAIGEKAKGMGITLVAFDRGPYKYHGRVKALAEAAREAGLKF